MLRKLFGSNLHQKRDASSGDQQQPPPASFTAWSQRELAAKKKHKQQATSPQNQNVLNDASTSTGWMVAPDVNPEPRRSGRERSSTTITIDGHTILKQNNYVVKGGDYVFGSHTSNAEQQEAVKPPPQKKAKTTNSQNKQPKQPSQVQRLRQAHNHKVMEAKQSKQHLQQSFLKQHVDRLKPFVEPKVLNQLQSVKAYKYQAISIPQQPKLIQTAILREYQLLGLQFLVNLHRQNVPMILGDEMGLGKTLQTISLLSYLKETEQVTGPSLVICPLSVLSSWCNECQKWAPSLKVFRLHASNMDQQVYQKQQLAEHATEYDVILTTYEMSKAPTLTSLYHRLHFHYLILDEGHKIKGHETQLAAAVRHIHCGNKLLLTGTPLQNNLVELWSLLNFLLPSVFTISQPFEKAFDLTNNHIDPKVLQQAQQVLDVFMLRRLKKEVETLMPKKVETKVYCPLSKTQTFWYKALLLKDLSTLDTTTTTATRQQHHSILKALFMQLRKCCNHPFVFPSAEPDIEATSLETLIGASGKLAVLDMLLQSLSKKGHRSVLFSQFTQNLDILEDYCLMRGWKYCRLDGSVSRAKRNYLIHQFNAKHSPYFLFLMSTRSGGMGLNLQTADTCIIYDSDWNPQADAQAMGRVHRIGQTKLVHVYRLVSRGTIEERLLQRAEQKLLLEVVNRNDKANQQALNDNKDTAVRGLTSQEMLDDIKFGSDCVFGNDDDANNNKNELPTWEEIEAITDRSRKESDTVGKLVGGTQLNSKRLDQRNKNKQVKATQTFGGVDFQKLRQEQHQKETASIPKSLQGIGYLWKEVQQLSSVRNRKSRIIQVQGNGSGYGSKMVPVLASNNYELEHGESSVFARELSSGNNQAACAVPDKKKKTKNWENQDFCQVCLDGGSLVCCPSCPVSVHCQCIGLKRANHMRTCPHHRCCKCDKNVQAAGGVLFPCHACAQSFCEDCLAKQEASHPVTYLHDGVERFTKLGFAPNANYIYINCSTSCEKYAQQELGYVPPTKQTAPPSYTVPHHIDVSSHFGAKVDANEVAKEVAAAKPSADEQLELDKAARREKARRVSLTPSSTSTSATSSVRRSTRTPKPFISLGDLEEATMIVTPATRSAASSNRKSPPAKQVSNVSSSISGGGSSSSPVDLCDDSDSD